MTNQKQIRVIELGEVSPVRSQTCYHAVGHTFGPDTPDTVILVSPNSPYVCVGFHQETGREVDLDFCCQAGLPVYRREVGGGAVYLDRDQLFVQWIFHPEHFPAGLEDKFRFYVEPMVRTYHRLGIPAEYRPVNDIQVAGKKICGTGAARINQAEVIVGSFMFDFDKKMMAKVLKIPSEKMRDKIFQSLEQYMTTIKELLPEVLAREKIIEIYLEELARLTEAELVGGKMTEAELAEAERLDRLFESKDWIFHKGPLHSPAIKIHEDVHLKEIDYKAPGGLIRLTARIKAGRLDAVWISGDFTAFPKEGIAELEKALAGVSLDEKSLQEAISKFMAQTGLSCPGVELEDWLSAFRQL